MSFLSPAPPGSRQDFEIRVRRISRLAAALFMPDHGP
jgi:hypothetical protein